MSLIGDGIEPFTPRKGIQFQESGKILLGFSIRNTTQGIRNPTNDWNPKSKFYWQRPKLYNNPTPLEFNQATPNAYHMIALCQIGRASCRERV